MSLCPFNDRLSAYLDGELDAERRAVVAQHVAECADCQKELGALKSISVLLATQTGPRLSQISLHRLHQKVDAVMEESLIRLAHVLQAVAACILVAGSVWLMQARSVVVQPTQVASVPLTPAVWDTSNDEAATPAAAFYLADASGQTGSAEDLP